MKVLFVLVLFIFLMVSLRYWIRRREYGVSTDGADPFLRAEPQVQVNSSALVADATAESANLSGSGDSDKDQPPRAPERTLMSLLMDRKGDHEHKINFSDLGHSDIEELYTAASRVGPLERQLEEKTSEIDELKIVSRNLVVDLVKARARNQIPANLDSDSANEARNDQSITKIEKVHPQNLESDHELLQQQLEANGSGRSAQAWFASSETKSPLETSLTNSLAERDDQLAVLTDKLQKYRVLEASRIRNDQQLSELRSKLSKALVFEQRLIAQNEQLTELKKTAQRVSDLEQLVFEKEKAVEALTVRLHESESLKVQFDEARNEVERLKISSSKIPVLEQDLQAKNSHLEALRQLEPEMVSMKAEIDGKTRHIEQLQRQLEKSSKVASLLSDREKELESLQRQLHRISALESELVDKNAELAGLRTELGKTAGLDVQMREIQLRYDARNTEIQSLRSQIAQCAQLETTIEEQEYEIKRLRLVLTESVTVADEKLERKLHELENLRADSALMKIKISAKSSENTELRARFSQLQSENDEFRTERLQHQNYAQLEADLKKRDRQIKKLSAHLAATTKEQSVNSRAGEKTKRSTQNGKNKLSKSLETRSRPDNLKLINGIGPVMESHLRRQGITTFRQLANLSGADISRIDAATDIFAGRIRRDKWVSQAKTLLKKKTR